MTESDFLKLSIYGKQDLPDWEKLDFSLVSKLEALTRALGFTDPLTILSLYRSPGHNAAIGGAPGSMHLFGKAVDFVVPGDPLEVYSKAVDVGFTGIGLYVNPANVVSMHTDVRPGGPARWSYVDGVYGAIDNAIDRVIEAGLSIGVPGGLFFFLTISLLVLIIRKH